MYRQKLAILKEKLNTLCKRNRRNLLNSENEQLLKLLQKQADNNKKKLFQEEIQALKEIISSIEIKMKLSNVFYNVSNAYAINNKTNPEILNLYTVTKVNKSSELLQNEEKNKIFDILKTIANIENELKHLKPVNSKRYKDQKHILSQDIAHKTKYMPMYRFKKELIRGKHPLLITQVSHKPIFLIKKCIKKRKINNTEQTPLQTSSKLYSSKFGIDQGITVTIEWCCPQEEVTTTAKHKVNKTETLINPNVTKSAEVGTTNIVSSASPSSLGMTQNLSKDLSKCNLTHDYKCLRKKIRQRGYQCRHHYKNHSFLKEHQLTRRSKISTSTEGLVKYSTVSLRKLGHQLKN